MSVDECQIIDDDSVVSACATDCGFGFCEALDLGCVSVGDGTIMLHPPVERVKYAVMCTVVSSLTIPRLTIEGTMYKLKAEYKKVGTSIEVPTLLGSGGQI